MIENEIQEIWKDVVGYEGYYQVSNLGKVKSCDRLVKHNAGNTRIAKGKYLIPSNFLGYHKVRLSKECKGSTKTVHRLVANAFIENVNNKLEVNHINGIRNDNMVSNLEWVTRSENVKHSYRALFKKNNINNSKPLLAFNKFSNELVGDFVSIAKASIELNICSTSISGVLNNKHKYAKGYYFKYKY